MILNDVKQFYTTGTDFIITCGQAYFLSYIMETFQMEDLNSKPSHPLLTENVKMLHQPLNEKGFSEIVDDIVSSIFEPFKLQVPAVVHFELIMHVN